MIGECVKRGHEECGCDEGGEEGCGCEKVCVGVSVCVGGVGDGCGCENQWCDVRGVEGGCRLWRVEDRRCGKGGCKEEGQGLVHVEGRDEMTSSVSSSFTSTTHTNAHLPLSKVL